MNGEDHKKPGAPADPKPDEKPPSSGEGSDTAYQAMLRKRKQAESPAPDDLFPPVPPLPPAILPQS